MDHIHDLFTQFTANCMEVDAITDNIDKMEDNDVDVLEDLYRNEFMLYMEHIAIYEDLLLNINREPKTDENQFELARIKKDAEKMLRVQVVTIT